MQKINPCLWFDKEAEDAAKFYVSIFKNSRILATSYYGESGPGPAGRVLLVSFELDGVKMSALNGGPHFKFSEAISMSVACQSQQEIDYFWDKLSAGGQIQQCGWLKDKFGLSWQIVPAAIEKILSDTDRKKTDRVMQAVMQMVKLDAAKIEEAYAG